MTAGAVTDPTPMILRLPYVAVSRPAEHTAEPIVTVDRQGRRRTVA